MLILCDSISFIVLIHSLFVVWPYIILPSEYFVLRVSSYESVLNLEILLYFYRKNVLLNRTLIGLGLDFVSGFVEQTIDDF